MLKMTSVESDICTHHDDTTQRIVKDDDRASGHLFIRDRTEKKRDIVDVLLSLL